MIRKSRSATLSCFVVSSCVFGTAFADSTNLSDSGTQLVLSSQSSAGDLTNDSIKFRTDTGPIFCKFDLVTKKTDCANRLRALSGMKIKVQNANASSGMDLVIVTEGQELSSNDKDIIHDNGELYVVEEKDLLLYPYQRTGLAWGALTVPYKYNLTTKQINADASVGPFIGWVFEHNAFAITWLGSFGFTPPSSQQANQGTQTAYHWAVGMLFTAKKRTGFQAGLVYGQDQQGQTSNQPWVALALGYSFQ